MDNVRSSVVGGLGKGVAVGLACFSAGFLASRMIHKNACKGKDDYYETNHILSEYLLMHYGDKEEQLLWKNGPGQALGYPTRCIEFLIGKAVHASKGSALEIGCAVGRSAYELSRYFEVVDAFDKSDRFIEACRSLQARKPIQYSICYEGVVTQTLTATCPEPSHPARISFFVGDACEDLRVYEDQRKHKGPYDCIVALNVLDRVRYPSKLLSNISENLANGGFALISSPFSWSRQFTDEANWLGGKYEDGKQLLTRDAIVAEMKRMRFDVVAEDDLQMLIRETARKHQWTVAHIILFRKSN